MQLKESVWFLFHTISRAWELQSDFGLWIICLHLQKLELFAAAIVARWDKRKGRTYSPCSCAYRTTLQNTSKVQQPSRRSQDIKELWTSQTGCLFSNIQTPTAFTLTKVYILSVLIYLWVLSSHCICTGQGRIIFLPPESRWKENIRSDRKLFKYAESCLVLYLCSTELPYISARSITSTVRTQQWQWRIY